MSLAIVLIVLFPLFVKLYRQYRWIFVFAVMLLPRFLNLKVANTNLLHYTFAMVLGMYCAQSDLFTRWKTWEDTRLKKIPRPVLFLFHLLILVLLVITVLMSMVIEFLKKKLHFYSFINKLERNNPS